MFQVHNIPVSRKFPPIKARNSWQKFLQQNNPSFNSKPCSTTQTAPKTGRGRRRFPTLTLKYTNNSGSDVPLYTVYAYFQIMYRQFGGHKNRENNSLKIEINFLLVCLGLFWVFIHVRLTIQRIRIFAL